MKRLLKVLFVLLLLLVVSVGAFIYLFDANKYKPEIIELVESYSGREIKLDGDIQLTVYPRIGVRLQDVTIANKAGFSQADFATIKQFNIQIKIFPLFHSRLEIDGLLINGLTAAFETNVAGDNNWSDILGEEDQAQRESGLNGLSVAAIEISDANLNWFDATTGKRFNLSKVDIKTGGFEKGQPIPLTMKAYIISNFPAWKAVTSLKTQLSFDSGSPVFEARELEMIVTAKLPGQITGAEIDPVTFSLLGDSKINVKRKSAKLNINKLSFLNLEMNGEFDLENILSMPAVEGDLNVKAFDALKLAEQLKVSVPVFSNPDSFRNVSLTSRMKFDTDSIAFNRLTMKLNQSELKGSVRFAELHQEKPKINYDVMLDELRWEHYAFTDNRLPVTDFIRGVELDGKISINTLKIADTVITSLKIPSNIKGSVLMSNPITMLIKKAKVSAAMELNAQSVPRIRASILVENLNTWDSINPFIRKVMGDKPVSLEGVVSASASLKSKGYTLKEHKASLNGELKLDMDNLILKGVDLDYTTKKVVADYAQRNEFRIIRSYLPDYNPNSQSAFSSLRSKFLINGNRISSKDIKMVSNALNISASGAINLSNNTLDFTPLLDVHVDDHTDIRSKLIDHPMEYQVKGTFENLNTQFNMDKYDLRVGRLLMIEAKARRIRAYKEKQRKQQQGSNWR